MKILLLLLIYLTRLYASIKNLDFQLTKLLIHKDNIYIAGVNHVVRLDKDFKITAKTSNGPVCNNKYCSPKTLSDLICDGSQKLVLEDNINKILLYTEKPIPMVITCGSIYQGICQFLDPTTLKNVTDIYDPAKSYRRNIIGQGFASSNGPGTTATAFIQYTKDGAKLVAARTITTPSLFNNARKAISSNLMGETLSETSFFLRQNVLSVSYSKHFFDKSLAMYPVYYKTSFQIGDLSYFTSTQANGTYGTVSLTVSKLIVVRFKDHTFTTSDLYVEFPLICEKKGVMYNRIIQSTLVTLNSTKIINGGLTGDKVLFGVFKSDKASKYAVCSFMIKDTTAKINELFALVKAKKEIPTVPWADTQQTTFSSLLYAPTTITVKGDFLHESKDRMGCVGSYVHKRGLSLYISYPKHKMKMYDVTTKEFYNYGEQKYDGDNIFNDISVGGSNQNIYAISKSSVAKFPMKDCSMRKSCKDCLAGPSCGWCVVEAKCSLKDSCADNTKPNYFISSSYDGCPKMKDVTPDTVSVVDQKEIGFNVENVPLDVTYKCSLNGQTIDATLVGKKITCSKSSFKNIPNFVADENGGGIIEVTLLTNSRKVASSRITIYDCSTLKMCKSCIAGIYQCGWCSKTMTCVAGSNVCPASFVPYQGLNSDKYKEHCPHLVSVENTYFPSGVTKQIVLNGKLLPPEDNRKYSCQLSIEGAVQSTTAQRSSVTKLVCDTYPFSFAGDNSSLAKLDVMFGKVPIFSNDISVELYKCDFQRTDCSSCLFAPAPYKCGWCKSKSSCQVNEKCPEQITTECPNPVIKKVTPMVISSGGGTRVVIEGTDFGISADKVLSVTLAGFPCRKTDESRQNYIVCKADSSGKEVSGKVEIIVETSDGNKTSNFSPFHYKVPRVATYSPTKGTCSGGTMLTIKGKNLNLGNNVTVSIGESACEGLNTQVVNGRSILTCVTSKRTECKQISSKRRRRQIFFGDRVRVSIDGYIVPGANNLSFAYEKDPGLLAIYTNTRSIDATIFTSGGQEILFEAKRIDMIQSRKMTLSRPYVSYEITCSNQNPVVCLSPNVSEIAAINNGKPFKLSTKFKLDGYEADFRDVEVVPDPVFHRFPGGVLVIKTDDLILSGSNLGTIVTKDVKVNVAGVPCDVTDVDKRLVCKLPSKDVVLRSSKYKDRAPVVVKVGRGGLSYNIGFIQYYTPSVDEVPMDLYVGLSVGLLILIILIIIIVCCIMQKRKKLKDKRYHELVQLRMDRMESQYARECKEAFAEYQTEITDLSHDVEQIISPYLNFRQYAMSVLYPGVATHVVLEPNRDRRPEWEESMKALIVLLKDKEFLLTFVRTLEGQSGFQMTDRCAVASLLMVSLQDDLSYVTDILMQLLKDLINKPGKKRPKLLLRRTESVAEKLLTNWLAYTLHGFLEDHVGQPLFNLFSAINILLDKEPVDAITSDAKNSLSEDKLLRQKIDFKNISITVNFAHDDSGEQTYEGIHVLGCDTITQTKEKIIKFVYKNKPFSSWPVLDELELGFPSASGALLVLKDEDSTNILEGEWKKINTLEHYKVPDKSKLRLTTISVAQNGALNESSAGFLTPASPPPRVYKSSLKRRILSHSLRSMQDIGKSESGLSNNMSLQSVNISTSTPMIHHVDGNAPKLWHMVKTSDYPQEQKEEIRHSKMMAEVFLTRLLKTKETLQLFVNNLFDSIFGLYDGGRKIPPSIKYLFDFLDKQAVELELSEDELKHTWKNNSLPLRFWINIIKNPNFVFDVKKSNNVDSCLSVIAQLFMDSCSPDEHRLGKDSPSNKLLYAKEIPEYKKKVKRYYDDIEEHQLSEEEFFKYLDEISTKHGQHFNSCNAARALLTYAEYYKVQMFDNLERNNQMELYDKLQDILEKMPDDG